MFMIYFGMGILNTELTANFSNLQYFSLLLL